MPCVLSGLADGWRMGRGGDWTAAALADPAHRFAAVRFKVDEQTSDAPPMATAAAATDAADDDDANTNDSAEPSSGVLAAADANAGADADGDTDADADADALSGGSFKLPLHSFMHYLHHNSDDVPLYVFDAVFDCDPLGGQILDEFTPPPHFGPDLFRLLGEARRPPYRWLLVGPPRSGSALHTDPLATAAWNTCVDGVKRWVLFPPGTPRAKVKGAHLVDPQWLQRIREGRTTSTDAQADQEADPKAGAQSGHTRAHAHAPLPPSSDEVDEAMEGVHYFMHSLPILRRQWASDRAQAACTSAAAAVAAATGSPSELSTPPHAPSSDVAAADFAAGFEGAASESGSAAECESAPYGMVEFLQYPGETVFVPTGWLHGVLNLTATVAVTQNYVSPTNLAAAWAEARSKRPHMARRWREQMGRHEPTLMRTHMRVDSPLPLPLPGQEQRQEHGDSAIDADECDEGTDSVPSSEASRRPDVDFEVAALDPDSWYWNPSSDDDDDDEEEDGENGEDGDDDYQ